MTRFGIDTREIAEIEARTLANFQCERSPDIPDSGLGSREFAFWQRAVLAEERLVIARRRHLEHLARIVATIRDFHICERRDPDRVIRCRVCSYLKQLEQSDAP